MRSAADVWEKVKSLMEGSMTAVAIDTWCGDGEAVALEDTRLVLCVPTDFKRNIIRTRFQSGVEAALKELFSFDVDVALLLPEPAHGAALMSQWIFQTAVSWLRSSYYVWARRTMASPGLIDT